MAKQQFASQPHPYYPNEWLDEQTASNMLYQAGLYTRLSKTRCKRDGIEVSSTGHIRKMSLEFYIQRAKEV
jgi:hypothetical protein